MGHKKNRYGLKVRPPPNHQPTPAKKSRLSTGMKVLIALTLIAIIAVSLRFTLTSLSTPIEQTQQSTGQSQSQSYPSSAAPVFYSTPALASNNAKVSVPKSYVNSNKLVFVDLKLQTPTETLPYQGRTVPLSIYKNGGYLPLILISTPSGNIVGGVRTCEPCGSFSFHIVKGTNLKCDACGTEWKLEDFAPVSGGCLTYPPPKLTTTVNGDNIEIDLSALAVQVAA
ncbi:MAG TPA: Fe-S-containing protein [Candidatus Sulfotelmatobacter sp.]|nr:Fe-S-containing protein [Candidatus Sulfotelmatobacter sp.]